MTSAILSPRQGDLLEAAFGDGESAIAAWRRWRDAVDWEANLHPAEYRALPRLHANLRRLHVDDPLMPRFKGVARRAYAARCVRLRAFEPTVAALAADGAEVLVLPPGALLVLDGTGVVDLTAPLAFAVRAEAVGRAVAGLDRHGWHPRLLRVPRWCLVGYARGVERLEWRRDDGLELDLVWQRDGTDESGRLPDSVWCRTRRAAFGGATVRVLEPGDGLADLYGAPAPEDSFAAAVELLLFVLAADGAAHAGRSRRGAAASPEQWRAVVDAVHERLPGRLPPIEIAAASPGRACAGTVANAADGSLGTRLARHWSAYRRTAGSPEPLVLALRHLPGYLIARWSLPSLAAIPRRFWRGLRAEHRLSRS